jgi:hypothetical protein
MSMVKALLSAVLAAAQVLSASVSPLYVCLGRDGSVVVDYGTADCGCCRLDGAECCDDEHEHCEPASSESHAADFNPCHCNHLQVAELQAATLDHADAPDAAPALAWIDGSASQTAGDLLATHHAISFDRSCPAPDGALALRACVELRL